MQVTRRLVFKDNLIYQPGFNLQFSHLSWWGSKRSVTFRPRFATGVAFRN